MIITTTHTKGGVGKSTLCILKSKILAAAGHKVLLLDMDYQNHSSSYYFNENLDFETIYQKNIYNVFSGHNIQKNIIKITDNIDIIHSNIQLHEFRNAEYTILKDILNQIKYTYDYILIDTTPGYDNLIANTYYASDTIIIPTLLDTYNYQALHFIFDKISEHEIDGLNINIVINQFQKLTKNIKQDSYKAVINQLFDNDEKLRNYYLNTKISKSDHIKQYIDSKEYKLKNAGATKAIFQNIKSYAEEITDTKLNTGVM